MAINNFSKMPEESGLKPFYFAELLILGGLIVMMAIGVYFSFTAQEIPRENQQIIIHNQETIEKNQEQLFKLIHDIDINCVVPE